ncbi:hypothetical protein EC957_003127 [Mortierella hygrophila]|uniref:Transglutaminase-like domain-containing protein n=1 Tax=Mortierella hygrophila TaxID=979708 RepID=A0A9P6F3V6_9FUNG|nr:hypothetical protein EC957_003127 [Mortierella hygrophila]
MNPIPGTKTSTKTSTVNGVTTVVTTVTAPGQPTRVTTTTTTTKPAMQPASDNRQPFQPSQPQQQPRPQPVQVTQEPPEKRKSGFFSTLKKHVLRNDDAPKRTSIIQQKPPVVQQQQPQQQRPTVIPAPIPQQQQQQRPQQQAPQLPVPVQTIRLESDDGPLDRLAEKMQQATLNRPPVEHHSSTTTTTTSQNGKVVNQTTTHSGDAPDDAIAQLTKSRPLLAETFGGMRMEPQNIDFSREDNHARACPAGEAATISSLSHYLTSPCKGNKISQLRTIFTWIGNNIAYDVAAFMSGRYGEQGPEYVLRSRKAVCEGYANLFIALAEPAGLQVQKVIGVARGVDVQIGDERLGSPHAWNAVRIHGEYLLIDSTWGAGVCDLGTRSFKKLFRPFFFLLRPNRLIYTHWPNKPEQQFLNPPIHENVFRSLPAIKPESWDLGIKLAGRNRGQVIRTKDDYVEAEIQLKKRPSDGATGKVVARLNWKGQSLPVVSQWLREDEKYVWMVIKCWCPSSGSGELNVFGWPPGGDQTKNGPQILGFRVFNDGPGKASKPLLQQYVVQGFAFSVLEPLYAKVKKNQSQVIRVRVFDVQKGVTPALAVQAPDGGMPERLPQVKPGLFEITKVLTPGQWKIVNMTSEYGFSFAAVFDAE